MDSLRDGILELERKLGHLFIPIDTNPIVSNMACTFKLLHVQHSIDLHHLCKLFNQEDFRSAIYEPDCWNALQLNLQGSVRAILHHTASGIISGIKSEKEIKGAIDCINDCIDEYLMNIYLKQ